MLTQMPEDHYVDLDGNTITLERWIELMGGDTLHRVIAQDTLPDGRLLRTVWCGTEFPNCSVRAFGTVILTAEGTYIVEIGQYSERDIAERCHAIHLQQITSSTLELASEHKKANESPEA